MSTIEEDLEQLERERVALGMEASGPGSEESANGRSIMERAEEEPEDAGDVEEGEQFPLGLMSGDPQLTFGKLLKPGRPKEVTASLTAAEVPIRDGKLLDPDKAAKVLVTVVPKEAVLVYKREGFKDGDNTVTGYKIRQPLKVAYIQSSEGMYDVDEVEHLIRTACLRCGVTESDAVSEILEDLIGRD